MIDTLGYEDSKGTIEIGLTINASDLLQKNEWVLAYATSAVLLARRVNIVGVRVNNVCETAVNRGLRRAHGKIT